MINMNHNKQTITHPFNCFSCLLAMRYFYYSIHNIYTSVLKQTMLMLQAQCGKDKQVVARKSIEYHHL